MSRWRNYTNLAQRKLSEKSDLLKAGLYFLIHPDKLCTSKIFTAVEKISHSFISNFKFEESESQVKVHLTYFAKLYFSNCKYSLRVLRQRLALKNLVRN